MSTPSNEFMQGLANPHIVQSPITHITIAFDVLHATGLVSVTVVLLTAWHSSQIRRTSTWFMFLCSWLLDGVTKLLLLGEQAGPPPPFGICVIQAALINASPVLCGLYAVALVAQTYASVAGAINSNPAKYKKYMTLTLLHILPLAFFCGAFILALILGLEDRTSPQRSSLGVYCHLSKPLSKEVTGAFIIFLAIIMSVLEVLIIIHVRRAWTDIRTLIASRSSDQEHFSLDSLVRVVLISLAPPLALVISCFQFRAQHNEETAALILVQSAFPLAMALLFGSQKDILQVWGVKRREKGSVRADFV
ncbi:hypothetical protein GALMADRAFT_225163 [Galerina marginata CBS 339.88]|uniref:G-protein coupled receptors family 1 profile domain-containing protein n=1 Tax=Galerina marginata (strain CBS 339.88) TaxID=685588 RepID=A0A067T1M6_GALM3|nr:hypothetical protein GALMADRAFT_225163 [Galerina marginata CBS 339.88]